MKLDEVLKSITILYIEDDKDMRDDISSVLGHFVDSFKIASNGKEALEIYEQYPIDIIITDICMPSMNGIELITKIRKVDKTTPIVVMTSYSTNDYLLKCANLNIQAYILKPISYSSFQKALYDAADYLKVVKKIYIKISETLSYDRANATLIFQNNTETILNKKEKIFMDLLVKHRDNLVSYSLIEETVWGGFDESMTSSALRTLVKNLRKKMKGSFIDNVSSLGYKLTIQT